MAMTATHHFGIAGLQVEAELLGGKRQILFEGRACTLSFPSQEDDFGISPDHDLRAINGYVKNSESGAFVRADVMVLRVEVQMEEASLSAAQAPFGGPISDETLDAAHAILQESANLARRLVAGVSAWSRTDFKQAWLEPETQSPRIVWISSLKDSNGDRLAIGFNDPMTVHLHGWKQPGITTADLDLIFARLLEGQQPSLEASLLADAEFYAWSAAQPRDELALIMAAVACEVKIKRFLLDVAKPEQAALVQLVIENPRDVSISAASLFDKALNAVIGRSLRTEDRDLYKALVKLFEHRNKFAHRGEAPLSAEQVREDLATARKVSTWLDAIVASEEKGHEGPG